jgi:hypothetical protein
MRLAAARAATVAVVLLALYAAPATAQRRADLPGAPAPVSVYTDGAAAVPTLGSLFNRSNFRVNTSYELSYSGFGGESLGLGVFTTTLRWQPTSRLAARVDVAAAHSPFGSAGVQNALGFDADTPARVYLRNAEIAYRPTDNSVLTLQIQQSPFGSYAAPYGAYGYGPYGSPFGYGNSLRATFGSADGDALFWRDSPGH